MKIDIEFSECIRITKAHLASVIMQEVAEDFDTLDDIRTMDEIVCSRTDEYIAGVVRKIIKREL